MYDDDDAIAVVVVIQSESRSAVRTGIWVVLESSIAGDLAESKFGNGRCSSGDGGLLGQPVLVVVPSVVVDDSSLLVVDSGPNERIVESFRVTESVSVVVVVASAAFGWSTWSTFSFSRRVSTGWCWFRVPVELIVPILSPICGIAPLLLLLVVSLSNDPVSSNDSCGESFVVGCSCEAKESCGFVVSVLGGGGGGGSFGLENDAAASSPMLCSRFGSGGGGGGGFRGAILLPLMVVEAEAVAVIVLLLRLDKDDKIATAVTNMDVGRGRFIVLLAGSNVVY